MVADLELTLRGDRGALRPAQERVSRFLEGRGASARTVYRANLVIEELFTNLLKFAFDDGESHEVVVRLGVDGGRVCVEMEDDGRPFDPRDVPERRDGPTTLAETAPGGLGIPMVRSVAASLRYRREADRNVVEVDLRTS